LKESNTGGHYFLDSLCRRVQHHRMTFQAHEVSVATRHWIRDRKVLSSMLSCSRTAAFFLSTLYLCKKWVLVTRVCKLFKKGISKNRIFSTNRL